MTKNLRYSIIFLLFLIPFVSLIVASTLFFPYITGKNLAFRLLVEIAAILYVLLALRSPEYRPRLTPIFVSFLAFLSVLFVADIFAEYPLKAFLSNFERMEGFVTIAHLFAYFVIAGAIFNTELIWRRFFQVSLGVSVIMGIIGINQMTQGVGRIDAQLGNPTYLGAYMLFHIFIGAFLLARLIERNKTFVGSIYALVILFDLVVFYYTGTRGALLGLLAGSLFISVAFAIFEKNRVLKTLGIATLAGIIIIVGSLAVFKNSDFVKNHNLLNRFAALATFDKTSIEEFATTQGESRFAIWGIALEGFKERPILGWGQDNFNYVFNKYYDPKIYDQEQWFDRAHNVFFDWLIAGGILGLLSYLALFILCVVSIWQSKADGKPNSFVFSDKVMLTALLVAYFIHNLFVFDNIASYILFFSILAFVYMHERKYVSWPLLSKSINNESYISIGSVAAIIIGGAVIYYCSIVPFLSAKSLIKALVYQNYALQTGNEQVFNMTLGSYEKAISYPGAGDAEAREQLVQGATNIIFRSSAPDNVKAAFADIVTRQMNEQIKKTPDDARYHFFYGVFLYNLSQIAPLVDVEESISYLKKAHELSPRKQGMLLQLAAVYINNKRYEEALAVSKESFELEMENDNARLMYATALIYSGDNKTADEILAPFVGTEFAVDNNLIKAYHDTNQNAKILAILSQKIILAEKYASEGKKDEAIQQIQEVISINPAFKVQGEALIKKIQEN